MKTTSQEGFASRALASSYLSGYAVHGVEQASDGLVAKVSFLIHPQECEECGAGLRTMGSQNRAFLDAPLHGRRLTLQVDRQRYRCANGHSPSQPLPDMVEGKQMTVRALRYIEHQCVRIPHSVIADRLKVTPKTVRDIALEYYGKLDLARRPAIVERLEVWATEFGGVDAVLLVDRGAVGWWT